MTKKRISAFLISILVSVVAVQSQSLVEAAQKEKERRENLRGRRAVVVTNEDLANLRKKPAIVMSVPAAMTERSEQASESRDRGSDSGSHKITPRVSEPGPLLVGSKGSGETGLGSKDLEEKLQEVRKSFEDLVSRMNALRQESFLPERADARELILKQIEELTGELSKVRQEESRLNKQIEALKTASKAT
ncbi:MAG: hypothetical protein WBC70_02350 [Candidatus Aminicenantales bacterium]